MKKILYLTFYFEPDLCAGSFRNSSLAKELSQQLDNDGEITLVTTMPNRYSSYSVKAPAYEERGNMKIHRITLPSHKNGFIDQINSFKTYYFQANKLLKGKPFDMVFASSSRLFTAYLGKSIASKLDIPLYLDIRDLFVDTLQDVLSNKLIKSLALPVLKVIENETFKSATHINMISGAFREYFQKYKQANYTNFTNGIDDTFIGLPPSPVHNRSIKKIVYAGNIGESQGLHNILPKAAKKLEGEYTFVVIGDGGAREKLERAIQEQNATNIELRPPVKRSDLLNIYNDADMFFLHLADSPAFEKAIPSKLFELGAYDKPIVAGVGGFGSNFIKKNIDNVILFHPESIEEMVEGLKNNSYKTGFRHKFIEEFSRSNINKRMAQSILAYLS